MNLRQIIRESINNVILDSIISEAIGNVTGNQNQPNPQPQQQSTVDFSQYANELRKIVGNSGINPKPVQNNQAAVQHIDKLNHFVFAVINAIDNDNIDGVNAPAAGGNSKWVNPYGKDKVDMGRDAMRASVNYLGNNAENLLGKGANNPFNGVFRAGVDAYNNTNNLFTQQINNRKYEDLYNNASRNGNAGGSLTYLMQSVNDGCYPRLQTEYNQINQQNNNIFGATPDVGNCYQVLQTLSVAVTSHANSQKQQNTQQPNGGQPGGGQPSGNPGNGQPGGEVEAGGNTGQPGGDNTGQPGGGNTGQPGGEVEAGSNTGQPGGNTEANAKTGTKTQKPKTIDFTENKTIDQYKNYFMQFDKTDWTRPVYKKIAKKYKGETLNEMNDFVFNLEGTLGECLDALETNSVRASDENRTRRKSLTRILGLTYDTRSDTSFYNIRVKYNKINQATGNYLANLKPVGDIMENLIGLYNAMRNNNMVDKKPKNSNGDFTKPFK